MATEQGYSNQKKKGKAQFKTIHSAGSDSYAEQVIPKYLYDVNLLDIAITGIQDILGANGQVEFWKITMVANNASVGNILQIKTPSVASLTKFEFEITSIVDVDNFLILPISNTKPSIGDTGVIKNWVSAASDSDGNPQVALAPAPIKFKLDGVTTDVSKDTAIPANSTLLPTENLIAQASLSSIDGKFTTLNAKDFATSAKQDTGNSSLSSIDGKFTTLNAKDFATSAKQDTGNSSLSSIDGKLQAEGVVDPGNSSVTPLGIGGVFTGAAFEITKYAAINVCVASDVASATNGVKLEVSEDGTNWDHSHTTTYSSATGVGYIFNAEFKYARVVYTNGAVAQTYFRLQTIFKTQPVKQSLYTISQSVNGNMFAELGKNVIIGETTGGGGGYVPVKVTPSGALTVEAAVTGSVSVSNFPATQPVSAASLPLPSGASTLAEQQTQSTYLSSIESNSGTAILPVHTETSAFTSASFVVSGIDPIASTVRAFRVNSSDQLLTFIGNSFVATKEATNSGIITQVQKTVGTAAVRATVSGSAPLSARKRLLIKPSKNNTGSIYFGASTVTTASGLEIIGPDRLEFLLDSSDYYLISDTAGQVVEIVEVV